MSTEYPRSTLDAVLAACTDHIYAYDAQGRYLYANPAGATALGMRPEEVTGRTWRELGMPAEAMEAFDELRAVVQRSGEPASQEMRFPAAEGVRQYMCTLKRVREEGLGEDVVVCTVREVTALKERGQALAEPIRGMLDGTETSLWEWDVASGAIENSAELIRALGFDPRGREYNARWWASRAHPDSVPVVLEARDAYERGAARYCEFDCQIRDAHGEWRWISARAVATRRDDSERPVAYMGICRDVTTERQTTSRLTEATVRWRALFTQSSDAAFVVDSAGTIVYHTDPTPGSPASPVVGVSIYDVIGEDDRDAAARCIAAAVATGEVSRFETRARLPGGEAVYSVRVVRVSEAYGEDRAMLVAIDITDRKRVEEQLAEEQRRFRSLMDHVPDPISFKDREHRFTRVNAAVVANMRVDNPDVDGPDSLLGKTDFGFHPEPYAREFHAQERVILDTGEPVVGALESYDRADGRTVWTHVTKIPTRDGEGRVDGLIGINRDVTELVAARETLAESEAQYRTLFEAANVAIGMAGLDGEIVAANDAFCDMVGYTRDELVGMPAVALVHPTDQSRARDQFQAAIGGRAGATRDELRYVHKDGSIVWGDRAGSIVRSEEGEPLRVVAVITDISERKRTELLQKALFAIGEAAYDATDLPTVCEAVHGSLTQVLDAQFFAVGLVDPRQPDLLSIPYRVDASGPVTAGVRSVPHSRAMRVVATGRPLALTLEEAQALADSGEIDLHGVDATAWLGAPLIADDVAIGAVWVRSPDVATVYGQADIDIMTFVAEHVGLVIARSRSRQALTEEQRLFHALMDNVPDIICFKDRESRFVRVNEAGARELGIEHPDDAVGKTDFDFTITERAQAYYDDEQELMRDGAVRAGVNRAAMAGGDLQRWDHVTKAPIYDSGDVVGLIGVNRNVTELMTAQSKVQESESRLRQLAENVDQVFWLRDHRTREWLYTSPNFEEVLGYAPEATHADPHAWTRLMHPDDLPQAVAAVGVNEHGNEPVDLEYRIVLPDGAVRWIRDRAFAVPDDGFDGGGTGHRQAGIAEDITARKRADDALRASEERFRQLADNMPQAFWLREYGTWEWLYASPNCESVLGYAPGPTAPTYDEWTRLVHPEDLDRVIGAPGADANEPFDEEYRIVLPDGEVRWIHDRAFPVYDSDGLPYRQAGIAEDITDRKATEAALRESEERFRTLAEATFEGIAVSDASHILHANDRFAEMHGYETPEIVGMPVLDPVAPESRPEVADLRAAASTGPFEGVGLRKDGTTFPAEVRAREITWSGRRARVTAMRDLTELRRQEERLQRSEERFRTLADATFEGIAITSADRLLDVNEQFAAMFGYERSELVGMPVTDIVAPAAQERVAAFRASEGIGPFEDMALRKDGTTFPAEVRSRPGVWHGERVGVTAMRDLTEQRRQEEELRRSEERFRALYEHAPFGIAVGGPSGRIIRANQVYQEITGRTEQRLQQSGSLDYTHPEDVAESNRAYEEMIEGKHDRYSSEKRYVQPDGSVRWGSRVVTAIRDVDGSLLYAFTMVEDITERREAEELLRKLSRAVEQTDDAIMLSDRDGVTEYVNPAFERLTGYAREEVYGAVPRMFQPGAGAMPEQLWIAVHSGEAVAAELSDVRKDGARYDVHHTVAPIRDANGDVTHFATTSRDVTERKRVEAEIRQLNRDLEQRNQELTRTTELVDSLERIAQAVGSSLDMGQILDTLGREILRAGVFRSLMVALVDEDAHTVSVARGFNRDPHGVIHVVNEPIVGTEYDLDDANITAVVARTGELHALAGWDDRFDPRIDDRSAYPEGKIAYFIPVKSGERVLGVLATGSEAQEQEATLAAIDSMSGLLTHTATALDHARLHHRAHEHAQQREDRTVELRALAARLTDVQEEERARIARDLHDRTGQSLAAFGLGLELVRTRFLDGDDDGASEQIERCLDQVEELGGHIRGVMTDLRPPVLDEYGLPAALEWFATRYGERTGLDIAFNVTPDARAPDARAETAMYRVAQEALGNVARHGETGSCRVSLRRDDVSLLMVVEDDGVGFDPALQRAAREGGWGLVNMRERMRSIGGTLTVESQPGGPTKVTAAITDPAEVTRKP